MNACLSPSSRPVGRLVLLRLDGALHFVDADVAGGQRIGIHLHAHGVLLRAEDLHARDAADHGDALRQQRVGILVDRVHRQRRRIEREIKDRLLGRIHLLIRRRARHLAAGGRRPSRWRPEHPAPRRRCCGRA